MKKSSVLLLKSLVVAIGLLTSTIGSADVPQYIPATNDDYLYDDVQTPSVSAEEIERGRIIKGILDKLEDDDPVAVIRAGLALRSTVKDADLELLIKEVKQGGSQEREQFLIEAIGEIGSRKAGDALRFIYEHGQPESKRLALRSLGLSKSDWPVSILINAMKKGATEDIRKAGASALGVIGTGLAKLGLKEALREVQGPVQRAAWWSLEKIEGKIKDRTIENDMPPGRQLTLHFNGTRYLLYHPVIRPKTLNTPRSTYRPRMLICVHDNQLDYYAIFEKCFAPARRMQMALLVPYFDNMHFPQFGNLNIRGQRSDRKLFEIIDHVSRVADLEASRLYFYGEGEGGLFVQNLALSYSDRIARAAIMTAEFTSLDETKIFPEGLRTTPFAPDLNFNRARLLQTDLLAILLRSTKRELVDEFAHQIEDYALLNGIYRRAQLRKEFELGDVTAFDQVLQYLFSIDGKPYEPQLEDLHKAFK